MKKLGLLIAPVLFALGCGGLDDVLTGADAGVCGPGINPHQLQNSPAYSTKAGSVTQFSTTCSNVDPVATQSALGTAVREFTNESGNGGGQCIWTTGLTPNQKLGCGQLSCNKGTMVGAYSQANTDCTFDVSNSITVSVLGRNNVQYCLTQTRQNHGSTSGGPGCKQTSTCTVSYCAELTGPP